MEKNFGNQSKQYYPNLVGRQLNEEPSLKKVCQIGLNIGQYQGYTRKTIKNSHIKNYLLNSDCCILLKDILTNKNILELEKLLQK